MDLKNWENQIGMTYNECREILIHFWNYASQEIWVELQKFDMPKLITFKSVRVYGEYIRSSNILRLNEELLNQGTKRVIKFIILHELSHVIVDCLRDSGYYIQGKYHGRTFKSVAARIGCPIDFRGCHIKTGIDLRKGKPIRRRKRRARTSYVCAGCKFMHSIGPTQMKKIKNGARYTCRKCGTRINPNGIMDERLVG